MNISEHVTISIELTPDEHEKLAGLDVEEDQMPLNPEAAFREDWSDIVAGRFYPASALWDDTDNNFLE